MRAMNQAPEQEKPESIGETTRKSGLAYGAALALFTAVVVMLAAGYLIDLYFASSPWGLVGGIVFGSIVGLYQFIRITNQIK